MLNQVVGATAKTTYQDTKRIRRKQALKTCTSSAFAKNRSVDQAPSRSTVSSALLRSAPHNKRTHKSQVYY
uniref:Ovule protein n=1 Tax=Steinernema glaseri TaxID=37863 RepID=A0A1I7ZES2_9BILA